MIDYQTALLKLESIGQEQLLAYWDTLNRGDQHHLLEQIYQLDLPTFKRQQAVLAQPKGSFNIEPFDDVSRSGNAEDAKVGKRLITQGAVGCLLVAGGQGTRLNFNGPKGLFPISPVTHKTLFQLFAERTAAASRKANRLLPLAIMTSPLNDQVIREYFVQHHFFGLEPTQLSFFTQGMLPFLNLEGDLFLEDPCSIAYGPDGNGNALHSFVKKGIWEQWHRLGVQIVNFVLIDNPLADPFDAELIGFHAKQKDAITIKCVTRRDAEEKVGLLVKKEGKTSVIEYSELAEAERTATKSSGALKHQCANISLFCFDMPFIKRVANEQLPLHCALKPTNQSKEKAWKFETFIFDLLPYTDQVHALLYPREECFAPLKNRSGEDSPVTVQKALQEEARRIYSKVTGTPAPEAPFELPTELYY